MLRILKWLFLVVLLLVVIALVGLPLLANTERGRKELAGVLGDALGRKVEISGLSVGLFWSSVKVQGFSLANPPGYPEGSLLLAHELGLDIGLRTILKGKIEGSVKGTGFDIRILQKGDGSNMDGLAKKQAERTDEGGGPDLHITVAIDNSALSIENLDTGEKLALQGVSLDLVLSNRDRQQDAAVKIKVGSIDRGAIRLRDLDIDAVKAGDRLALRSLTAKLAGAGTVAGKGSLETGGGNAWSIEFDATAVRIDQEIMPVVASMFPPAASAGGQFAGILEGKFKLEGKGLAWEAAKPTLKGGGDLRLKEMALPDTSLLAQLAELAGRSKGGFSLNDAGATFTLGDGWLSFSRLSASGDGIRHDFEGRVSLDGRLELTMDLSPLAKRYGGGSYAKIAQTVKKIPVRIGGSTASPRLEPPKLEDLAKSIDPGSLVDKLKEKLGR